MKIVSRLLVMTILLSSLLTLTDTVHAKILNKDMVDKAVLATGYSADFCPINFQGDYSNMSTFFQNKESFPCIGDNEEFRFGQVSLYLRQSSIDSPTKVMANVVLFGEDIFRLDSIGFTYYSNPESGGTFTDEMHETIRGLELIESTTLHRTHPSLPGGQETLQNSGFSIHYGLDGKIDGIVLLLSGKAYKLVNINTEVHDKVLVDYTIATPNPSVSVNIDSLQYKNSKYEFSLEYPKRFQPDTGMADSMENYETVAILKTPQEDEKIYINIIRDIDIYKNSSAIDVARREIMDSGYKYDITPTTVNQYSGASTVIDTEEPQIHSIAITVKHPTKNLYIVLVLQRNMSKVELEQILSSFIFIDQKIDSTANWKTHANTKYGFEFKSPNQLEVVNIDGSVTFSGKTYQAKQLAAQNLISNVNVRIIFGWTNIAVDPYGIRTFTKQTINDSLWYTAYTENVANEPGCFYASALILTADKKNTIELSVIEPCPSNPQIKTSLNELGQILSTFKFIK